MRVVVADTSFNGSAYNKKIMHSLKIEKRFLFPGRQNPDRSISEAFLGDDVSIVVLDLALKNGKVVMELGKGFADSYSDSPLEKLWERFRKTIKFSVDLKYAPDKNGSLSDFASFQGIGINPKRSFVCVGSASTSITFFHREPKIHVKIVAEVNENEAASNETTASTPVPSNEAGSSPDASMETKDSNHPIVSRDRIIFEEGLYSDVTIFAQNQAEIKSHRCFLAASSPVLRAMFQNNWTQESQTGQVDMTDASENVVRLFLRFLYFGDLEKPKENVQLAFEMFKMAEKYDVQSLKDEMTADLLGRRDGTIKVELAFQMYMFTRNIDSASGIKAKARGILKANFSEMKALQDYQELFIDSPQVGKEVFEDFMNSS